MRRPLIAAILTLATGLPTLALAGAPPKAQLRNFICQQALDPASRATSIKAVMRPVPGTMKLAMRFELLKRVRRAGRAVSLSGPRLKSWIAPKPSNGPAFGSQPGDIWVVKHPVVDLAAPSYYQFRVAFRWFDGAGKVIATSVRQSAICFQPELRADLAVTGISQSPSLPGQNTYVATIENRGRTAAGRFKVEFMDGPQSQVTAVSRLAAHQATHVSFTGPVCSVAVPATVVADPGHTVDDANRANNSMAATCS